MLTGEAIIAQSFLIMLNIYAGYRAIVTGAVDANRLFLSADPPHILP